MEKSLRQEAAAEDYGPRGGEGGTLEENLMRMKIKLIISLLFMVMRGSQDIPLRVGKARGRN